MASRPSLFAEKETTGIRVMTTWYFDPVWKLTDRSGKFFPQQTITAGIALPFYDNSVFILDFHVAFQVAIQPSHNTEFRTIT